MTDAQEETELDDGRKPCDWRTRFGKGAWFQIVTELAYLVILMVLGLSILFDGALWRVSVAGGDGMYKSVLTGWEFKNSAVNWIALWTAGLIGGTVFDLKWLYHSVAKATWNQDRVLWRLIVPFNSSIVSLFTGYLFASGAIPFLKNETFDDLYTLLGFGFIFGYFSDNILAAMQNLAQKIFGTLGSGD